jgi:hypothetical protein
MITSASSRRMVSKASPMLWPPVEQAATIAILVRERPSEWRCTPTPHRQSCWR